MGRNFLVDHCSRPIQRRATQLPRVLAVIQRRIAGRRRILRPSSHLYRTLIEQWNGRCGQSSPRPTSATISTSSMV
jgi:hypothetical protein